MTDRPEIIFEKAEITLKGVGFSFTEVICGVCDKPATDATFQGIRVHASCGPLGAISDGSGAMSDELDEQ